MKIGNIVYGEELVNHTKSKYINYYNESIEYDKLDKSLPTLYVGWSFMKESNPNNLIIQNTEILEREIIKNNLYWEVSFKEGKAPHIKGVDSFVRDVPQYYFMSKYDYIVLDPVFSQLKTIEELMAKIPENLDITYTYKDEMLYLLSGNNIFGINLKMFEFFKFDPNDILFEITKRIPVDSLSYYDFDGEIYQSYYKIFPNFDFLKRYIVTILSK